MPIGRQHRTEDCLDIQHNDGDCHCGSVHVHVEREDTTATDLDKFHSSLTHKHNNRSKPNSGSMKSGRSLHNGTASQPWVPPPARTSRKSLNHSQPINFPMRHRRNYFEGEKTKSHSDLYQPYTSYLPKVSSSCENIKASCDVHLPPSKITDNGKRNVSFADGADAIENRKIGDHLSQLDTELPDQLNSLGMLTNKLIEVEVDGEAISQLILVVKSLLSSLLRRQDDEFPNGDSMALSRQLDLLNERLSCFDGSSKMLRKLLRQKRISDEAQLIGFKDSELVCDRSLLQTQDELKNSQILLMQKDQQIEELQKEISSKALSKGSLESNKAHLQKNLRQKDADCNRMAVQIRTLECQLAQEKIEVEHLKEALRNSRKKVDHDKEALKKTTRVQKNRALKNEDAMQLMTQQLNEQKQEIHHLQQQLHDVSNEKEENMSRNLLLRKRISEIEECMNRSEQSDQRQSTGLTPRVTELSEKLSMTDSKVNSMRISEENDARIMQSKLGSLEGKIDDLEKRNQYLLEEIKKRDEHHLRIQTSGGKEIDYQRSRYHDEVARENEEIESRLRRQVIDLKERLEQSHSANRSMQNYVTFLKSSYASVFGDEVTSLPSRNIHF